MFPRHHSANLHVSIHITLIHSRNKKSSLFPEKNSLKVSKNAMNETKTNKLTL